MKIDFSSVNLQYLIRVRDIAQKDPDVAMPLLGLKNSRHVRELYVRRTIVKALLKVSSGR
jgi:hypothetical protein